MNKAKCGASNPAAKAKPKMNMGGYIKIDKKKQWVRPKAAT